MHLPISWRETIGWLRVRAILKNMLSLFLGRWANQKNRKGFVDGGSRKKVVNRDHFNYLMTDYLPKKHHGEKWFEGNPLPSINTDFLRSPRKPSQ